MTDRRLQASLDQLLSNATVRIAQNVFQVAAGAAQPDQSERLTAEEEVELRAFAMSNLRNNGTAASASQDEDPFASEEPAPDPYPGVPQSNRPIAIPEQRELRTEVIRFSDAEWFHKIQDKVVILAGVGGIGSNLAVILAKLNPRAIYIFDDDLVEAHNIAGQFYSKEQVGMPKVDALVQTIIRYTGYSTIYACNRRYLPSESIVGEIMICGFDSMTSRKDFYQTWRRFTREKPEWERKDCLFIDGRLSADELQVLCMTGEDSYYMEQYERRFIFPDSQAASAPCTFKQTGYMAQMIGSIMVNLLVNFCANQANPVRNMKLPFFTDYKSDMMYFTTEV